MDRYLEIFELPPARGSLPGPAAYALGVTLEGAWLALRLKSEPLLSRYQLAEVMKTHTYKIDKARVGLGYAPVVSTDQGFDRVAAWVREEGLAKGKRRG
jgi:nucleoside-diphosphate-sugar epimerase